VSYLYGFAAALGGGPYDRRATLADPSTAGFYREVSKQSGLSLAQALSEWAASPSPRGVIRVLDSELYNDPLPEIGLPAGHSLVLEAANGCRPVLITHALQVTGTGAGRSFILNGFLIDVEIKIAGSLELLVTHCTLVPRPGRPNVTHTGDASDLRARLTFSITGPLHLPDDIAELRIEDGILDAASTGGGATPLPALVSVPLSEPLNFGVSLALSVKLGTAAAQTVTLDRLPADVPDAAAQLQQAIRAAGGGPGYTGAVVTAIGDRLLVRSGTAGEVVAVSTATSDPRTASDLALLMPPARALRGVLSGDLMPFPVFTPPQVLVTLGGDGPYIATFSGSPDTPAKVAMQLEAAIRAARPQPAFTQATVTVLDDQLLVRPGIAGASVAFAVSPADPGTVTDLALLSPPAARVEGVFSGRLTPFPVFPGPEVKVTIGGDTGVARLSGASSPDLEDLAAALQSALHDAAPAFPDAEVLLLGNRLLVRQEGAGSAITFATTATDKETVAALALAAPPAERLDSVRLSSSLATFPDFPFPSLKVEIAGDERTVEMRRLAADLGTARTVLQEAVRAAAGTPTDSAAFAGAEVLLLGDRLLVRSGDAAVEVQADAADGTTAAALALESDLAGKPQGLLSGEIGTLPPFPLPALRVSFGGRTAETAQLAGVPHTLREARTLLEAALRGVSQPAFTKALVAVAGDQLLVASGV
ncbi:MAG TPA: hypothetical protein VMW27_19305, partial [Thermoanaerobaculia bacterium]|nr:hypothetical protein [Thermoanaerobaculia bacterium]